MAYLEENYNDKWREITTVPVLGPGNVNSFKSLPFIFSKDNFGDGNIEVLKTNYIVLVKFAIFVFITCVPLALFTILPWGANK